MLSAQLGLVYEAGQPDAVSQTKGASLVLRMTTSDSTLDCTASYAGQSRAELPSIRASLWLIALHRASSPVSQPHLVPRPLTSSAIAASHTQIPTATRTRTLSVVADRSRASDLRRTLVWYRYSECLHAPKPRYAMSHNDYRHCLALSAAHGDAIRDGHGPQRYVCTISARESSHAIEQMISKFSVIDACLPRLIDTRALVVHDSKAKENVPPFAI